MIGRRDFFYSCTLCFFPYSRLSSGCLRLSHCLISFLLFPCVSVCKCLGKHSCRSSSFPIAILNGTCFFSDSATTMCIRSEKVEILVHYSKPILLNQTIWFTYSRYLVKIVMVGCSNQHLNSKQVFYRPALYLWSSLGQWFFIVFDTSFNKGIRGPTINDMSILSTN